MKLIRGERQYVHYPFWGLGAAVPEIKIGLGSWQFMTLASSYTPPTSWTPPADATGSPTWYQALLATPEATSNPVGAIVITDNPSQLRIRVTAGDEIDILPDGYDEWIHLIA